eukprot:jgi/Tetstr1/435994/TSEL_024875.t1
MSSGRAPRAGRLVTAVLLPLLLPLLVSAKSISPVTAIITPDEDLPEICGDLLLGSVPPVVKKDSKARPHNFYVPAGYGNHRFCVPQKNGNRMWGGLLFAMHTNKKPSSAKEVINKMHMFGQPGGTNSGDYTTWFFSRNPYSRILSVYLNKVVGDCGDEHHSSKDIWKRGCGEWSVRPGDLKYMKVPTVGKNDCSTLEECQRVQFAEFVKELHHVATRHGGPRLCEMNHHLCPQAISCLKYPNTYQLKLEREVVWYACLLQKFGLTELAASGWEDFTGRSCFYHGGHYHSESKSCEYSMHIHSRHTAKKLIEGSNPTGGTIHSTGAFDLVETYFTPEVAQMVAELYKEDFETLHYPVWDGTGHFQADLADEL